MSLKMVMYPEISSDLCCSTKYWHLKSPIWAMTGFQNPPKYIFLHHAAVEQSFLTIFCEIAILFLDVKASNEKDE